MNEHKTYILRCIQLAKKGLGYTYPNPLVGCVVVHNNRIIGEGWHQKSGYAHAEVNAIQSVKDKSLLKESTIYVSLEPCAHFGKTPPCADLIINYKIPNVVIGTQDPFAQVQGKGIKKLQDAGCHVIVGVLEDDCKLLNKRFFTFHNNKRPYIILKWAQTLDGFIAPKQKKTQEPVWISNAFSKQLVHKWRSQEQAILVGTRTVLEDNPTLTTRDWKGTNPIRLIIDKDQKLSKHLNVFNTDANTFVFTKDNTNFEMLPQAILNYCYNHNIQSLIIEGGLQTLQSFINLNVWDEARIFEGKVSFTKGTLAPNIKGTLISLTSIQNDVLKIIKPKHD